MEIKNYRCKECGCRSFYFDGEGKQIDIYCINCGALFKRASKKDITLIRKRYNTND